MRFTLCADDYGLNPEISFAILELIRNSRLNSVSCMLTKRDFNPKPLIEKIKQSPLRIETGLHLTLTEYAPLGPMPDLAPHGTLPSVGKLLTKAHLRRVNLAEITQELTRQFDAFEAAFRKVPDFVDGHQHVHIFPGIRDVVTRLAGERMQAGGWIRCCDAPVPDLLHLRSPRAMLLASMARQQRKLLTAADITHNSRFYGVNSFDVKQPFRALMQNWLQCIAMSNSPALIMCHPGHTGTDPLDPIAARRPDEFGYLNSTGFIEDMQRHKLSLS